MDFLRGHVHIDAEVIVVDQFAAAVLAHLQAAVHRGDVHLALPGVGLRLEVGLQRQVAAQAELAAVLLRQPRLHQGQRQSVGVRAHAVARPVGRYAQAAAVAAGQAAVGQGEGLALLAEARGLGQRPGIALGRDDAQRLQRAGPGAVLRLARRAGEGERGHLAVGLRMQLQVLHRAARLHVEAVQRQPGLHAGAGQRQLAIAALPRQPALQAQGLGGIGVELERVAGEVGLEGRRGARAGELQRAGQHAGGAGQQVGQLQRVQGRIDIQRVGHLALRLHAAGAQAQIQLALAAVALQDEVAAAGQLAVAQAAAQLRDVQRRIEPRALACGRIALRALAGQLAGDRALPAGGEVARVEVLQRRRHVPGQLRRPADLAGHLQPAGRSGRLERLEQHLLQVAAAVEVHLRLVLSARQIGRADRRPVRLAPGHAQVRIGPDARIAFAPLQAARVDRELEARVLGLGEVGMAVERDAAVEQLHRQRLHGQRGVVDAHVRGLDHHRVLALLGVAADGRAAVGAAGLQVEGQRRRIGRAHAQQRQVQLLADRAHGPVRLGRAAHVQMHAHRRRRVAAHRHLHVLDVAAGDQPQPRRRLAARGGEAGRHGQVGVVVVARPVVAVDGEVAAVAGDLHRAGFGIAIAQVHAAADAAEEDHRLAAGGVAQPVDLQRVGLQVQRQLDLRHDLGPARQLERLVRAGRDLQRGVLHFQPVQAQALAQQRAQVRIQQHTLGGEVDAVHVEVHVAQRQRPGDRAFGAGVGQRTAGRQARDHLRQQHVAAGHGLQQPVQPHQRHHHQRGHADRAADGQRAHARLAPGAQLRDARLALLGGDVLRRAAHRLVPMLKYSCTTESGSFRPWAMSTRTGPIGER
ncbi:hypothetical protein QE386_002384 [Pseudoxanthomonas winnipegensis]|nr:hypothetical protein [Pseudoxanthomonas winnipegensis]